MIFPVEHNKIRSSAVVLLALAVCTFSGCRLTNGRQQPGYVSLQRETTISTVLADSWGLLGFRSPSQDVPSELIQLEPYQPGKVPVVFVHGLLSAPGTWKKMITDLRADPVIRSRYQFWVFRYATGVSYLQSANDLREQLRTTVQQLDPDQRDPAMSEMVLIGHSMGGLLSKLQVSQSQGELWSAVSDQPFDTLQADETTRQQIRETLFFEPLRFVKRVVFIATPHRGSQWTEHPIGKLARKVIEFPQSLQNDYQRLVGENAEILKPLGETNLPTSVDHLSPGSPLLDATAHLPVSSNVAFHSIIGTGHWLPDCSIGDGIVSQRSAHFELARSELHVSSNHNHIQRDPATIREVHSTLLLHLKQVELSENLILSQGGN